jgi:carbon-monoxide dehydrogenase medium subunit
MKPAAFDYVEATTVDDAVVALAADDGARVLAGGQSLVPLMNLRLARPSVLVDVNRLDQLAGWTATNGTVQIGAVCRQRDLELDADLARAAPLLAEAASFVAHEAIRNRGTVGGSLAHGDPSAELPAALLALDGHVVARSADGVREIAARDLFRGFFETALEQNELLTEIVVPAAKPGGGSAFSEYAPRDGDYAVAGVAVALQLDATGACTSARAAGCGLGSATIDLTDAVAGLSGIDRLDGDALRGLAAAVAGAIDPPSDVHATADDRRELAQGLLVDAARRAWARAKASAQ